MIEDRTGNEVHFVNLMTSVQEDGGGCVLRGDPRGVPDSGCRVSVKHEPSDAHHLMDDEHCKLMRHLVGLFPQREGDRVGTLYVGIICLMDGVVDLSLFHHFVDSIWTLLLRSSLCSCSRTCTGSRPAVLIATNYTTPSPVPKRPRFVENGCA